MRLIAACSAILVGLTLGVVRPLEPTAAGPIAAGTCAGALVVGIAWRWARARSARAGPTPGTPPPHATPPPRGTSPPQATPGSRGLAILAAVAGLATLVALAAWWASLRLAQAPDPLADLAARRARVVLEGTVAAPPVHAGTTARVSLTVDTSQPLTAQTSQPLTAQASDQVTASSKQQPTQVQLVDWWDGPAGQLVVGDRVRVAGRIGTTATGPRRADELLFPTQLTVLATPGQADPRALPYRLRQGAMRTLQAALPEPEGTLAAGLLLGSTSPQDPEFRQQLQRSGLSHLLAVDGYKQVLVSGALQAVAVRVLGRWRAVPLTLLGITAYTLLTGASPSAVRAGLMLGLSLLAGLVGRLHDPLSGLLLAASLMGLVQPGLLLELAFQLSFGATLGLVLFYPRLRYVLRKLPKPIAEPAGLTLAVTVATLPVTLVVFQQVSLVSPLAHIVAVPLVPPVLLASVLVLVTQPYPVLARPAVWLCGMATHLLAQTIGVFGSLPGAAVNTGHLPALAAAALAIGLLAWGVWELPDALDVRRRLRRELAFSETYQAVRTPLAVMLAGLLSTALLLLVRPDGRIHVTRLPVRRGEAVLVRGPGGASALVVDGAVDPRDLYEAVRQELAVWERSLDVALVLDAADAPRLGQVLQAYPARLLTTAEQDARLDFGRGAVLDVFSPPAGEVRLSYGHASLSLTESSGEAGPLLEPDEDQEVQHDHEKHDDQFHSLADDHAS